MAKTKIDLEGRDNASRAFQSATDRLAEMRAEIGRLRGTNLTVGDARTLNTLTGEANRLERALGAVGTAGAQAGRQAGSGLEGLRSVLSGIGVSLPALGAAGVAALGVTALRAGAQLGQLGVQTQRAETYFATFSGSAAQAATNLAAMEKATDGALSKQQAMQAATKLLSMGLASNAADLEKLSRMAVLLGGDTRSASEAIEEFSLLLANQSILRLDTFGISGARVRARIEELIAADAKLTREQAFLNAVLEIGGQKVAALEAAGVSAGTGLDRAQAATANLKAAFSKLVEKPYTVVVETVTKAVTEVTESIEEAPAARREIQARMQRQELPEYGRLQAATLALADAEAQLTQAQFYGYEAGIAAAQAAVAQARAQQQAASTALDAAAAAARLTDIRANLSNTTVNATDDEWRIAAATRAAADADRDATTAARDKAAARLAWGSASNMATYAEAMRPDTQRANWERYNETLEAQRLAAAKETNQTVARDYAQQMSAAAASLTATVQNALQKGSQFSINLKDLRGGAGGDPFAPGANGPFENIYRLQAWINDGTWAETAQQLGIQSKGAAQAIVTAFQQGNITPGVEGVINMGQLVDMVAIQQQSEASYKAFAERVAKLAGADTTTASTVLGGVFGTTAGQSGRTGIEQTVQGASQQLLNTWGEQVAAEGFRNAVNGYGAATWGYFETGFVGAASRSAALQAAIDAMVAASLSKRGAVSGAANGYGMQ